MFAKSEKREAAIAAAKKAAAAFWGRSNGSDDALEVAEAEIRRCKLSGEDLDRVRMLLPPIRAGTTTGDKIRRMDSLLKRLAASA